MTQPAPETMLPPATPASNPTPAPGSGPRFPRWLLGGLVLILLFWMLRGCSRSDWPLAEGDRLTWIQLNEGPGTPLDTALEVKEVRGAWFRVRPKDGDSDRWLRFADLRSAAVKR